VARKAVILLVEDDAHDVELMQLAFEQAKCSLSFIPVQHGGEATQYLKGEGKFADRAAYPEPNLVLLDLAMPVMDGFAFLRWMGQRPETKWPPVVVFSYSKLEGDVRLCAELGAMSYFRKPVDLDGAVELVKKLDQFCQSGEPLTGG
jgi:CheY-like chemotaxis protein